MFREVWWQKGVLLAIADESKGARFSEFITINKDFSDYPTEGKNEWQLRWEFEKIREIRENLKYNYYVDDKKPQFIRSLSDISTYLSKTIKRPKGNKTLWHLEELIAIANIQYENKLENTAYLKLTEILTDQLDMCSSREKKHELINSIAVLKAKLEYVNTAINTISTIKDVNALSSLIYAIVKTQINKIEDYANYKALLGAIAGTLSKLNQGNYSIGLNAIRLFFRKNAPSVLLSIANTKFLSNRNTEGQVMLDMALKSAYQLKDDSCKVFDLTEIAKVQHLKGLEDDALNTLNTASEIAIAMWDENSKPYNTGTTSYASSQVRAIWIVGLAQAEMGYHQRARDTFASARELARKIPDEHFEEEWQADSLTEVAHAQLIAGFKKDARNTIDEALKVAYRIYDVPNKAMRLLDISIVQYILVKDEIRQLISKSF